MPQLGLVIGRKLKWEVFMGRDESVGGKRAGRHGG
jgi:hypothetical protein